MKKRGMIEVHFNWIFILIAGAVIFLFFVSMVNKQREFSEVKTSGSIITNLESILTGAQVSTGTVNIVDLPKVNIGFECDRYFIGQVPKQTKGNVIFAPSLLKGKKLITWALDWNMPYRVTNFLYITDPELRYVIVNRTDRLTPANKIYDELPKDMNKEIVNSLTEFKDKNNYKVRFIFFDDKVDGYLNELKKMPDEDVTAIVLTGFTSSNLLPPTGTIEFFQKDSSTGTLKWTSKGTTYYLKQESLFGAIFAADYDMYNCVMRKAFTKLNLVSKIYFDRSSELKDYYALGNSCFTPHNPSKLKDMIQDAQIQSETFPTSATGINAINKMQANVEGIKLQNHDAQLYSCALIY